jgi:hypothetical protein
MLFIHSDHSPVFSQFQSTRVLITKAAITPGIQPTRVKIVVIKIEPQPLSKTARGGKIKQIKTRKQLIAQLSF